MFPCIMHDPIPLTVPGKCERASLICTTRLFLALASPSALPHRPVALSLSHLRRGVKGWQAEVSWHTSFSADKYLSTGWEKHMRTFLSRTNYSCIFLVFFSALPPFLPPSRCGDESSCSCHCSYSPGPGRPYRVNCIISRRASPPASLLTVQLKAAPQTALQPRYILRPEAGVGAIKWSQRVSRYSEGTNTKVQGSGFSIQSEVQKVTFTLAIILESRNQTMQ